MGNKTTRALRAVPVASTPIEVDDEADIVSIAAEVAPLEEVVPVTLSALTTAPARPVEHASDALGRYMEELRTYPILDRETEHEVALHYEKTQDREDARGLIGSSLRLVVKLAR